MKALFGYYNSLNSIVKFIIHFIFLMTLFYLFYYSSFFDFFLLPHILKVQATLAKLFLSACGYSIVIRDATLIGDQFQVSIKGGCDGIEASALYAIALISLPLVARKYKILGLIVGLSILFLLNIIRIAGLYLAGIHWPAFFEFFHLHGGVIAFLLISVIMWLIWVQWVMKKTAHNND
ncbi:MAG: archaeosortase/exosortase family protein [Saprospiraceae bacterium]|nr:archaeosortase/exosortase family protein [Candidatus Vicinibacter affinis]